MNTASTERRDPHLFRAKSFGIGVIGARVDAALDLHWRVTIGIALPVYHVVPWRPAGSRLRIGFANHSQNARMFAKTLPLQRGRDDKNDCRYYKESYFDHIRFSPFGSRLCSLLIQVKRSARPACVALFELLEFHQRVRAGFNVIYDVDDRGSLVNRPVPNTMAVIVRASAPYSGGPTTVGQRG